MTKKEKILIGGGEALRGSVLAPTISRAAEEEGLGLFFFFAGRFVLTPQRVAGEPLHGHGRRRSHHGQTLGLVPTASQTAASTLLQHGAGI
jgi:hypothetical protein